MQSVGICGSDVHFWVEGRIGDFVLNSPTIMGHEASGVVVGMGDGVTSLALGKPLPAIHGNCVYNTASS